MKKTRVLVCLLFALAVVLGACFLLLRDRENVTPVQLAVPMVILDGDVAKWSENLQAERFEISINGILTYMENTATSIKLLDGQTLKVRAIGDGVKYLTGGWSNSVTYTAPGTSPDPDPEPAVYTVTFFDEDGETLLATLSVREGEGAVYTSAVPEKDDETVDGKEVYYLFEKWVTSRGGAFEADLSNVRSNMSVYACYKAYDVVYTVTFLDFYGEVLSRIEVGAGGHAIAPATVPSVEGYSFTGWSKDFQNVKGDLLVEAVYQRLNKVRFLGYDRSELKVEWVESAGTATPPTPPTVQGYTFVGWQGAYSNVQEDTDVWAIYNALQHQVVFKLPNGSVLSQKQVQHGFPAEAPEYPAYIMCKEEGKDVIKGFTDWNTSFSSVESDMEITAIYQESYTQDAPVLVVKLTDITESGMRRTAVDLFIYVADAVTLNALQINIDFTSPGDLNIEQVAFESGLMQDKGYNFNNNEKTFSFAWASTNGLSFTYCHQMMRIVISANGGVTVSEDCFRVIDAQANVSAADRDYVMVTPIVIYTQQ